MNLLLAGALLFIVTHFGLSAGPVRRALVAGLGEKAFTGVYSLISFVTFGVMVYGFIQYEPTAAYWMAGKGLMILSKVLMFLALLLLVMGVMNQSPLSIAGSAPAEWRASGVLKITRHPVQWALLCWGLSHLLVNSDPGSLIFFGTFVVVAGLGTVLMDKKFAHRQGANLNAVFAQTSNLPFLALLKGKTSFAQQDVPWQALVIGVVLYTALYLGHEWLIGIAVY